MPPTSEEPALTGEESARKAPAAPADRWLRNATIVVWMVVYVGMVSILLSKDGIDILGRPILIFLAVFMVVPAGMVTCVVFVLPLRIIRNLASKDRRRSHRTETIALTTLLVLIVAYPFEVKRERNRLSPPEGVTTLAEFASVMPSPRFLHLLRGPDRKYIAWQGDRTGPFDLPSGPSFYLFNEQGDLIEWQPESGDGGPIDELFETSSGGEKITLDEAMRMVRNSVPDSHADIGN